MANAQNRIAGIMKNFLCSAAIIQARRLRESCRPRCHVFDVSKELSSSPGLRRHHPQVFCCRTDKFVGPREK